MANRKTVLNFCVYIWEPKYTIQGRSRNFFYVWSYSFKTFHSSVPSHTTFYIDSCGCDMRSTFDIILEYPTSKRSSFVWAEILFVLISSFLTRPMVVRQDATRSKRLFGDSHFNSKQFLRLETYISKTKWVWHSPILPCPYFSYFVLLWLVFGACTHNCARRTYTPANVIS